MRNFYKLADGVATNEILHALMLNPDLWNQHKYRTTFTNTPFAGIDDIWIKFNPIEQCDNDQEKFHNAKHSTVWYPAVKALPEIKIPVLNLMRAVNGVEIERCVISRVAPGAKILPHIDNKGDYVNSGDIARYHIVLQGLPGSMFYCGDEEVCMRTGEVWVFNPLLVHSVVNNSADDRIHLLVDIRMWP